MTSQLPLFVASSPVPGYQERIEWQKAVQDYISDALQANPDVVMDPTGLVERVRNRFGAIAVDLLREEMVKLEGAMDGPLRAWFKHHHSGKMHAALTVDPHAQKQIALTQLDALYHHARRLKDGSDVARMLTFLAEHRRFSVYNNMLVYVQNPQARYWDDSERWKKSGRTVKIGARPLLILQPGGPFKVVYDISDTDGKPIDLGPSLYDAWGKLDENRFSRTRQACEDEHILISEKDPLDKEHFNAAGTVWMRGDGRWDAQIALQFRVNLSSVYGTLVHELAHIFLGHLGSDPSVERRRRELEREGKQGRQLSGVTPRWPDRQGLTRAAKEVEAESVSFLVCSRLGLVTPNAEYIAGWIDQGDSLSQVSVDYMVRVASTIESMGGTIVPTVRLKTKNRPIHQTPSGESAPPQPRRS